MTTRLPILLKSVQLQIKRSLGVEHYGFWRY